MPKKVILTEMSLLLPNLKASNLERGGQSVTVLANSVSTRGTGHGGPGLGFRASPSGPKPHPRVAQEKLFKALEPQLCLLQ